jgi:CRP-like cAMP-binding protein
MGLSNVEALRRSELFSQIADTEIEKLAVRVQRMHYAPDHVLFNQGDPGLDLFVVTSGQVRIGLDALPGEAVIPAMVGPGESLGELAMLDGLPRSATATTTMDTELLRLSRADFMALVENDPAVVKAVFRSLAGIIRRSDERISELMLSVPTRMARRLLELAETQFVVRSDGVLIDRVVTDSELAGLTGLHRIHVEHELANYQLDDHIRMEFGKILLRHPERFMDWAGWSEARRKAWAPYKDAAP